MPADSFSELNTIEEEPLFIGKEATCFPESSSTNPHAALVVSILNGLVFGLRA